MWRQWGGAHSVAVSGNHCAIIKGAQYSVELGKNGSEGLESGRPAGTSGTRYSADPSDEPLGGVFIPDDVADFPAADSKPSIRHRPGLCVSRCMKS